MLFNFVLVWLYNYFDLSVTDESYVDETRVCVLNYKSGTVDIYLHHWVDATAGGRFVPEGIIIRYIDNHYTILNIFCIIHFSG